MIKCMITLDRVGEGKTVTTLALLAHEDSYRTPAEWMSEKMAPLPRPRLPEGLACDRAVEKKKAQPAARPGAKKSAANKGPARKKAKAQPADRKNIVRGVTLSSDSSSDEDSSDSLPLFREQYANALEREKKKQACLKKFFETHPKLCSKPTEAEENLF